MELTIINTNQICNNCKSYGLREDTRMFGMVGVFECKFCGARYKEVKE